MSARSLTGDPQLLYGSSAAHADSEVLHPVIRRGRAAAKGGRAAELEQRLMYAEYCAPDPEVTCAAGAECSHALDTPGCGCDNPEFVAMANPAVGRLMSMDFLLTAERRSMDGHEYGRERMGWHDRPVGQAQVITLTEWAERLDERSEPGRSVALSVVYTSDKRRAAIGLAGYRFDGSGHVEVADYLTGTDTVPGRVGPLVADAGKRGRQVLGVAVDGNAHEKACIKPLMAERLATAALPTELKVRGGVRVLDTGDVTEAYAAFYERVTQARDVWHRGQADLTAELNNAAPRAVGDGGEAWGRRKSEGEIATVVAVTNALWLLGELAPQADAEPGAWAL